VALAPSVRRGTFWQYELDRAKNSGDSQATTVRSVSGVCAIRQAGACPSHSPSNRVPPTFSLLTPLAGISQRLGRPGRRNIDIPDRGKGSREMLRWFEV
jgi:hypothetical protein